MSRPDNRREFGTDVVLSVTTGRMLAEPGRVYQMLTWMTNQSEFNLAYRNQAFLTCAHLLNQQLPWLAGEVVPDGLYAPLLVRGWVTTRMGWYGGTQTVRRYKRCGVFSHSYGKAARSLVLNQATVALAKAASGRRIQTVDLALAGVL